jgi:hypothetical protein
MPPPCYRVRWQFRWQAFVRRSWRGGPRSDGRLRRKQPKTPGAGLSTSRSRRPASTARRPTCCSALSLRRNLGASGHGDTADLPEELLRATNLSPTSRRVCLIPAHIRVPLFVRPAQRRAPPVGGLGQTTISPDSAPVPLPRSEGSRAAVGSRASIGTPASGSEIAPSRALVLPSRLASATRGEGHLRTNRRPIPLLG